MWAIGCSTIHHRKRTQLPEECEKEFLKDHDHLADEVLDRCFERAQTHHKSIGLYTSKASVSKSDMEIVKHYMDQWAYLINKALRTHDQKFLKKNQYNQKRLDKAILNFPIYRGIVFRGSEFPPTESVVVGKIFKDKAYVSTSRDATVAEGYAGTNGYLTVILSRSGRSLAYDKSTRDLSPEKEVLFPRDRSFKIHKIQKDLKNNLTVVYLIELLEQ